ncbi:unnamed protein product [Chrysodeixis includens]|uniref:Gustatory receptor n=1 Tax=Chrysodeixis includens TaxID=689277 RepID=A0A9P0FSM6_CHRIL|nr:unnamed protein product [Chrysodeixis includens]
MKVSDTTTQGRLYISPSYQSMRPILCILKIFALNSNIEPTFKSSFVLLKYFCTSVTLGCIQFLCLYYKIVNVYINMDLSVWLSDMTQTITDYFQYIVDLFFVYKYGRNICLEYFKQYEKIDSYFDIDILYYIVLKRKLRNLIAFFVTIWLISSLGDLVAWGITYGWMTPMVHSITYLFLFIKILTMLDLIAHVNHITFRLKIISNLVQNCYASVEVCPAGLMTDCIRNRNWLYPEAGADTFTHQISAYDSYEMKRLTKCYLTLTEQVAFINKMYGFRILLNTVSLLLDMVKLTNVAIRIVIGSQRVIYNHGAYNYLPGVSGIMRLVTCCAIIIASVDQCEKAYRVREQIINVIDHLLIYKNPDESLRTAMLNFRSFLQERPIYFNMANFFTLNYSLLMSVASIVVTYTIILLQNVK